MDKQLAEKFLRLSAQKSSKDERAREFAQCEGKNMSVAAGPPQKERETDQRRESQTRDGKRTRSSFPMSSSNLRADVVSVWIWLTEHRRRRLVEELDVREPRFEERFESTISRVEVVGVELDHQVGREARVDHVIKQDVRLARAELQQRRVGAEQVVHHEDVRLAAGRAERR
eukprot:3652816-Pleurochrysis_carterae.AAC.1